MERWRVTAFGMYRASHRSPWVAPAWWLISSAERTRKRPHATRRLLAFGAKRLFTVPRPLPARSTGVECASAHTIPGADNPMSTPRPDKTIDELFAEFLADQEARLSPQTLHPVRGHHRVVSGIPGAVLARPRGKGPTPSAGPGARTAARTGLKTSPPGSRSFSAITCPTR